MKSLYLECNAGISGDMLVAALLDLGADKEALAKALQSIPAKGFEYKISRVSKAGVDCCDFDVIWMRSMLTMTMIWPFAWQRRCCSA